MYAYKRFRQTFIETVTKRLHQELALALDEPSPYEQAYKLLLDRPVFLNTVFRVLKITLIKSEDLVRGHSGSLEIDNLSRFWFDVSYEQEIWDGPCTGVQAVHRRVITEAASVTSINPVETGDIWHREHALGLEYVQKRIPEAVCRTGQISFPQPGPNLYCVSGETLDGHFELVFYVDFDFAPPNSCHD
jgi:hypothetical protein